MRNLFILLFLPVIASSQEPYSIADLKNGKNKTDTSYGYTLPFEHKKKVFLIQAYERKYVQS